MPKVLKRFKMVNDGIRAELHRTSKAYKDQKGVDIDLVDCWDRFFKSRKNQMVATGRNFVNEAIEGMRTRWTQDSDASVEWNDRARAVHDAFTELESHIGEIYMDDLELEKLS